MTNSFFVAVFVLWSTNTMDELLTPAGNDIRRNTISVRKDVYTLPGMTTVTNITPVKTNSVRLQMVWVEVPDNLPPVPIHTNAVPK